MTLCLDFDAQHMRPSEEKKGGVREELVRYKGKQMAHIQKEMTSALVRP